MSEVARQLTENSISENRTSAVFEDGFAGNPVFLVYDRMKMRFLQFSRWLHDQKSLIAAVNENETLKKALFSPVRQPIEGSRYRIGDCLSEYLPNGETRRYKICGIQNGGLSNVYTVVELNSMQPFCLKENRATFGNPQKKDERLAAEAEISRRLGNHPNLVALHSVFRHRSRLSVVYEYVAGQSLDYHLRRRRLDLPTSLRYAADICRALVYAGEKIPGFVHGDIKPANCLITTDGRLKLADFGHAAESLEKASAAALINARRFGGTYIYMAPEMFTSESLNRQLADVYAFGATFFEMLAGKRPVRFRSREELLERRRRGSIEIPFDELETLKIPPPVIELVAKCLADNPLARLAGFAALDEEIARLCAELDLPPIETPSENLTTLFSEAGSSTFLKAQEKCSGGDFSGAQELLEERLRANYADVAALNLMGETLLGANEFRRAAALFRQALCFDRWQPDSFKGLCRAYLGQNQPRQACRTAEKALKRGIFDSFFYEVKGDFHKNSGDFPQAVESYKKALMLSNSESPALQKAFMEAVRLLAGADGMETEKLLGEGARILARSEFSDGQARLFVKNLLKLPLEKNKLPLAVFALDEALASCLPKISEKARENVRQRLQALVNFAARERFDFDIYYAAGKIYYHLECYEECEAVFRLSLADGGGSENAFYYLGACRELAGDFQRALGFYKSAHRLNRECELNRTAVRRVSAKLAAAKKTAPVSENSLLEES